MFAAAREFDQKRVISLIGDPGRVGEPAEETPIVVVRTNDVGTVLCPQVSIG